MPNQLAVSRKRRSFAEHEAVLAALDVIAESQQSTFSDVLREGLRRTVLEKCSDPEIKRKAQKAAIACRPQLPDNLRSATQIMRYKREQRIFDELLQELGLVSPEDMQNKNSIHKATDRPRLVNSH